MLRVDVHPVRRTGRKTEWEQRVTDRGGRGKKKT